MTTVAVDFDGVLHTYWKWDGNPPRGMPIEGARDALSILRRAGYKVVVHTSRDPVFVRAWLDYHGFLTLVDDVTREKPIAEAYFDDRAWRVTSNTPRALTDAVSTFLNRTQTLHATTP